MSIIEKYVPKAVLKVFSYTAVSTLVKMLTGFISLKIIARMVGAEGVVMLGQVNNFSSIILVMASGGIANGITKYVAEYKDDSEKVNKYISTAFQITLSFSALCALFLLLFSSFLSRKITMSNDYGYVFIVFAATIFFYALNGFFTAIVNGFQDYKKYVLINISNSIVGLLLTVSLVFYWQMKGVLLSAVTYQSVVVVCTFFIIYKLPWLKQLILKIKVDSSIWKQFLRYSLMTFTTAATVPVAQLLIRSMLVKTLSVQQAGMWEGINRISGAYLAIFVTSFSVYYLPRLSEIQDKALLKKEVLNAYKLILPILTVFFSLIFLFREQIVLLLFTKEFLPMQSLFIWQLAADFIKISGWLIGFIMIAKAHMKFYIFTEVFFCILYVLLSYLFIEKYAIFGVMAANAIMYACYFLFMIFFFEKKYKIRKV